MNKPEAGILRFLENEELLYLPSCKNRSDKRLEYPSFKKRLARICILIKRLPNVCTFPYKNTRFYLRK